MSLNKPILDDRSYQQIRDELIARIPVYAPEWTDHNPSDPGIALIELFSYLTENMLYRFNQIPEATKLEFLRLLQMPLHSATPATSMLTLATKELNSTAVPQHSQASAADIKFTLLNEVNVLPISALAALKMSDQIPDADTEVGIFYQQAAASSGSDLTSPYRVETVWQDEPGVPRDLDETVDGIVWIALMVDKASQRVAVRDALLNHPKAPLILNIGFVPETRLEAEQDTTSKEYASRFRCPGTDTSATGNPVNWQISTGRMNADGQPLYYPLQVKGDTTDGLNKEGVVRLQLPSDGQHMDVYTLEDPNLLGVGDLPPPLDDEAEQRIVCWIRGFRNDGTGVGKILYIGANAALAEQTTTASAEFIGTGNGQPNQAYRLNHTQVIAETLQLQVEEPQGWENWIEVERFHASSESDRHYLIDKQAGVIRFGTAINGRVPQLGQRIRVTEYRYGGGRQGNVAAGAINKLLKFPLLKSHNPLAAQGGEDAESLEQAILRIPGELRRRHRAVTQGDFKELALQTPGANLGRSEVLPRYHPQLPGQESAGVVSVIIWPSEDKYAPNAPMPDKNQIRKVCQWLDARRLVTTEMYVLPPKYVPIALAVGIKVKNGFGIDAVRHWVELALRQYLAPLPPYGPGGQGWPLGRRIYAPELEAAAHQVEGVEYLEGLSLVGWDSQGKQINGTVILAANEVPELIGITVENGPVTVNPGDLITPDGSEKVPVPIPVIKEVC